MSATYSAWLVGLSIGMAILVSYTALRLAARVAESNHLARRIWLLLGAISMGVGIWSMHFVGMLAFSLPIPMRYDIALTLASLGIAIVTSGFAIALASGRQLGLARHLLGSLVMGFGIVTMHYMGMSAIQIYPNITYDPTLFVASAAIAITASFCALWLAFRLRAGTSSWAWLSRVGAAIIMGLAIAGMHYTGMAAAYFHPGSICRGGVLLDNHWLAISIAVATFGLLSLTLVTAVFDSYLEGRTRLHALGLRKINARLAHQAMHDALTELPNRAQFVEAAQRAISDAVSVESKIAVMLVDLDRFKIVNDSLGHELGDAVLREVAARLREVVGTEGLPARMGGDEFLVMLMAADTKDIVQIAHRIVARLAQTYLLDSMELHLSASVGLTIYPYDNSPPAVLISHADEAMYEVKHNGGNGLQFFVPGTTLYTRERLELENDLWQAADSGQLRLNYQPQVELRSGRIVGVEALARWHHPSRGWVSPGEFIPIAESSDLILKIGSWVLEEACRQLRLWRLEGIADLTVAVNMSARQFRQPGLVEKILKTLASNGVEPDSMEIELTESIVMADAGNGIETLNQLCAAGFTIAVDDFGTGYSSLSYLQRLPIGRLKIDQSFVRNLGASAESDGIVQAVIALAHGLNMSVVAEGVETPAQLERLRAFGCDFGQGYLFGRPRKASDLREELRRGVPSELALVGGGRLGAAV